MQHSIHHVRGRLRVRSPALRSAGERTQRIARRLEGMTGIRSVVHRTNTGSLTVSYDPAKLEGGELVGAIFASGLLDARGPRRPITRAAVVRAAGEPFARLVAGAIAERVLERSGLGLLARLL